MTDATAPSKSVDSFFNIDESVPMPSERVSINPVNNLDLGEGQKLEFFIDPTTAQYIKPKSSSLSFKVNLSLPAGLSPIRAGLDFETGANVLLKEFRCWSGDRSVLLEEISDMNTLIALKYDYENDQNIRNKRSLTEGVVDYNPATRCTEGGFKQFGNNVAESPYTENYKEEAQGTAFDDTNYLEAKVVLPINSGLWSQERMLLVEKLGGLRLEWILEDNKRVFRKNSLIQRYDNVLALPYFLEVTAGAGNNWDDGAKHTTFYVSPKNNMRRIKNFPYVVGQRIKFAQTDTSNGGVVVDKIGNLNVQTIGSIGWEPTANGGRGAISVTMTAEATLTGYGAVSDDSVIMDESVPAYADYKMSYTISDAELLITKLSPPAPLVSTLNNLISQNGQYKYDFPTYTCYKVSQGVSDRIANLRLPINNSRCKAIACVPTDATIYSAKDLLECSTTFAFDNQQHSYDGLKNWQRVLNATRTGITGIPNHITSYQMVYNNVLNPSEPVNVAKTSSCTSIDQIDLYEREKCIRQMGWDCLSLRQYCHNFFIGRALGLGSGTYDARDKGDFNLQVNYEETTAPTKDLLWKCFVCHIRRINITKTGLSLEV